MKSLSEMSYDELRAEGSAALDRFGAVLVQLDVLEKQSKQDKMIRG